MKSRPIIILAIAAFIGLVTWFLVSSAIVATVPSDQFGDTLRKQPAIIMNSQMTRAPEKLPLSLQLRYPKKNSHGSIGVIDRSDVYGLTYGTADIECIAHIRGDSVCHVTLNGHKGVEALRKEIQSLFPRLSVD